MNHTLTNISADFVFELSKSMEFDNLNYIYRGLFTQNIIVDILSLTEKNIVKVDENQRVRKKVYNLMVECLQNITKHQAYEYDIPRDYSGMVFIQDKGDHYYITTGNLIKKDSIDHLKGKLEMVNSLDKDELKEYYRRQLIQSEISDRGGAGLGFIDMARKSGNKLFYDFAEINDEFSYFYFRLKITVNPEVEDEENLFATDDYSLRYILRIHEIINKNDIVLIYNNIFSEESRLNLLTYLQNQLADSVLAKKEVYNVMVEMLRNIVMHGTSLNDNEMNKPAIFFICEKENEFILNSGNYIRNIDIGPFKNKLDMVNYLDKDQLDDLYQKRKQTESKEAEHRGIGIIDMRLKSIKDFEYSFVKFNDSYSFFTLQISVLKD